MTKGSRTKLKYKSKIAGSVHKSAQGLKQAGGITEAELREFDALCLAPAGAAAGRPKRSGVKPAKR